MRLPWRRKVTASNTGVTRVRGRFRAAGRWSRLDHMPECPDPTCDGFFHRATRECCGWEGGEHGCSSICRCPNCRRRNGRSDITEEEE